MNILNNIKSMVNGQQSLMGLMLFSLVGLLLSCSSDEVIPRGVEETSSVIRIGGINVDGKDVVTASLANERAPQTIDAADVCESWLKEPLFKGWDVKYWLQTNNESTAKIAKVTLQKDLGQADHIQRDQNGLPDYTFKYRASGEESTWKDALWHGDGLHIFQGVYAPDTLYNGLLPADITTNQNKSENYNLLSHYLAMKPDCKIRASVARTYLPYRHRLARLKLYVLIDPNLKNEDGTRATIKGYQLVGENGNSKDDPSNSAIEFTNVQVLQRVDASSPDEIGHVTYTPVWTTESSHIIPHSLGEFGSIDKDGKPIENCGSNCIVYYDDDRETYIVPSNKKWSYYHNQGDQTFVNNDTISRIDYGMVPCYDLIVRPTYTKIDSVMYDEHNSIPVAEYAAMTNSLDVTITLSNGLVHTSHVVFDLDANYQLEGYLLINEEKVDYVETHTVAWDEKRHEDGWYGVDNLLGHTLSKAGSSWQRAFRIIDGNHSSPDSYDGLGVDKVTDGNFYNKAADDDEDGKGQYITESEWQAYFQTAIEGGAHHGDYFILDKDITLDGGITFTGHLDAQGHSITFTNALTGLNGNYSTAQETDENSAWEANVHKEKNGNYYWVPWKTTDFGYRAEILNAVIVGANFLPMTDATTYDAAVTGYIYNCRKQSDNSRLPDNMKAIPQY